MCVAQRPLVSDVLKGLCITILSSKDWAGTLGSCATASPPHRHTQRGDLDMQVGTRDLSASTQDWTLLQLACGEQAGFLHTRHDISELIPSTSLRTTTTLLLIYKPFLPTACPFASWPQFDGGDGICTQLRHRVSTFHRWQGEALHGGEEKREREWKKEREGVSSPAPKRGRFHTVAVHGKSGPTLIHSLRGRPGAIPPSDCHLPPQSHKWCIIQLSFRDTADMLIGGGQRPKQPQSRATCRTEGLSAGAGTPHMYHPS